MPYNDVNLADKLSYNIAQEIKKYADFFKVGNETDKNNTLCQLKILYQNAFGKGNINRTSLFLYSGLINLPTISHTYANIKLPHDNKGASDFLFCNEQCSGISFPWGYQMIKPVEPSKCSILYTGDGFLKSSKDFQNMKNFFGTQRMENIEIFQFIHHGSRYNWHVGLADKIVPSWSVFSADPEYI